MKPNSKDEMSPFQDTIFLRIMEGILTQSKYKRNVLLSAMGSIDKEVDTVPYYTMDCALCYLTYKEIQAQESTLDNKQILHRLENRAKKNMLIMEQAHAQLSQDA
tara:strand:+ start:17365 stop:17679 length:315 start_codon:yes stop_codon:yes gene_type:complete